MKKLLYLVLFIAMSTATLTSCTEEEVKPQSGTENGAGGPIKE